MSNKDVSDLKGLASQQNKNWPFVKVERCSIWIQNNSGDDANGAFDIAKVPLGKLDYAHVQAGFTGDNGPALVPLQLNDNERAIISITVTKPDAAYMDYSKEPRTLFYMSSPKKAQEAIRDLVNAAKECNGE